MLGEIWIPMMAPILVASPPAEDGRGGQHRRSRARNMASVPCRCGHSCTVPGSGPARSVDAGEQRGRVLEAYVVALGRARRTPRRRSRRAPASRSRRPPPRRAAPRRAPSQQRTLQRHQAPPRRARCAATAPPAGGAARRDRSRARRRAPGRTSRARHAGPGAVRGDHAEQTGSGGRGGGRAPGRPGAAAARRRAAGRRPGRPAPRAARTCPRAGAQVEPARVPAVDGGPRPAPTATSCDPSSCTPARPSATAGTAPGSPPEPSCTAYGDRVDAVPPAATSSSTVQSPGRATRVTFGGSLSAASSASSSAVGSPSASASASTRPSAGGSARPRRSRPGPRPGRARPGGPSRQVVGRPPCAAPR